VDEPDSYETAVKTILNEPSLSNVILNTPNKRYTRVGLKIYTNSGPGLCTPLALTKEVINNLVELGYQKQNLFILDLDEYRLRESGYLPSLSIKDNTFYGVTVIPLLSHENLDSNWFYESPLPKNEKIDNLLSIDSDRYLLPDNDGDRRSLLPAPLILDADYWINLPVFTDHSNIGLNGALANGTLWNITNNARFLLNSNTGQIGMAEIAAIPEIKEKWILNIGSVAQIQYIGGPEYRSFYTISEGLIIASQNALVMDYFVLRKINEARLKNGFLPLRIPKYFDFSQKLGLFSPKNDKIKIVNLVTPIVSKY
jgi:hypothetical protein